MSEVHVSNNPPSNIFDPSNPDPRIACVLLLDTSASMGGEGMDQLNEGLRQFVEDVKKDRVALDRVELAIVTFGPVRVVQPFTPLDTFQAPTLVAEGTTPLGEAIHLALDMVQMRKEVYRNAGIPYYRPWAFLVTDGTPTDLDVFESAAQRVREIEAARGLTFHAFGVQNANMQLLNSLGARPAHRLRGFEFNELFLWLSSSISSVSKSNPGVWDADLLPIPLPPVAVDVQKPLT
ncbi:MAG: hypothetical protein RLY87_2765 [Chloroflexota bacterium]|jgi:uncharacterized protein YegL